MERSAGSVSRRLFLTVSSTRSRIRSRKESSRQVPEQRYVIDAAMLVMPDTLFSLPPKFVMPGLVPGIHVLARELENVDGRDKPGQARTSPAMTMCEEVWCSKARHARPRCSPSPPCGEGWGGGVAGVDGPPCQNSSCPASLFSPRVAEVRHGRACPGHPRSVVPGSKDVDARHKAAQGRA